jgi:hypothetical protein
MKCDNEANSFVCLPIHQTATSLQRTDNLNPRTKWYSALDESNRMKSAYFTIHPGKNPPPQNGCQLKSVLFLKKHRFHIPHFPNSTGLFTKPTGRHYTKYRFSPDIAPFSHMQHPPGKALQLNHPQHGRQKNWATRSCYGWNVDSGIRTHALSDQNLNLAP